MKEEEGQGVPYSQKDLKEAEERDTVLAGEAL
jgi:hypothetical protein